MIMDIKDFDQPLHLGKGHRHRGDHIQGSMKIGSTNYVFTGHGQFFSVDTDGDAIVLHRRSVSTS